jgi:hypothetical protein
MAQAYNKAFLVAADALRDTLPLEVRGSRPKMGEGEEEDEKLPKDKLEDFGAMTDWIYRQSC